MIFDLTLINNKIARQPPVMGFQLENGIRKMRFFEIPNFRSLVLLLKIFVAFSGFMS